MDNQELLAVLGMTKDEQALWVQANVLGEPFDPKGGSKVMSPSLSVIAFRLRNAAVSTQCRYGEDFETVALAVQNYVLYPPPNPQLGKDFQSYLDAVRASSMWVDNSDWWMRKSKPIHWIIAAFIVKELAKC